MRSVTDHRELDRPPTVKEGRMAERLWSEGLRPKTISRRVGVKWYRLRRWLKDHGHSTRPYRVQCSPDLYGVGRVNGRRLEW